MTATRQLRQTRQNPQVEPTVPPSAGRRVQRPRARMAALTMEELRTFLSWPYFDPRQRLMYKVAFWHGLRVSELIALTKADIQEGHLACQRLKGSMGTIQPFVSHPELLLDEATELHLLAKELRQGERLFPWDRSWVRKLMQKIGRDMNLPSHKMHPHALKHTIAKLTIRQAGIENVRQRLGHKSIASTGMYLEVSDDEAAQAIVSALG